MAITIAELVRKYNLRIVDGDKVGADKAIAKHPEHVEALKAHKAEIIEYINTQEEAKQKAYKERQTKIAAIEGLETLRATFRAWETYHEKFNSFIENDAIGKAPVKPTETIAEIMAKYPRAAAYIKAEAYCNAASHAKSAAGRKAKEAIINGEDYEQAITDMEAEWTAYCDKHIWD